jgi:ribitol 2-dehydrogenase
MPVDMQSLEGKVAIVTGAGSGIGAASSRALASLGARVVLAGRRVDRLEALRRELGEDISLIAPTDVAKREDVDRLIAETLARFGRVDILLANAGQFVQGTMAEVDTEALISMVNVNVSGVIRCVKGVLPPMIAQGSGDIVVTSSISGHQDIANEAVYSATKHAIMTLVNLLRNEVAPHGIRVASMSPGIVLNEIWGVTDPADVAVGLEERRGLCSEDIAALITYTLQMPRRITLRDMVVLAQKQLI